MTPPPLGPTQRALADLQCAPASKARSPTGRYGPAHSWGSGLPVCGLGASLPSPLHRARALRWLPHNPMNPLLLFSMFLLLLQPTVMKTETFKYRKQKGGNMGNCHLPTLRQMLQHLFASVLSGTGDQHLG